MLLYGSWFLFTDEPVSFVIPREKGGYVMRLTRKIVTLDWDTKEITALVEIEKKGQGNGFNDGKCDPAGRLWAGESSCRRAIVIQFNETELLAINGRLILGTGKKSATRPLVSRGASSQGDMVSWNRWPDYLNVLNLIYSHIENDMCSSCSCTFRQHGALRPIQRPHGAGNGGVGMPRYQGSLAAISRQCRHL